MNQTGKAPRFTRAERRAITESMRRAATALADTFELLRQVNDRTGYEWAPTNNSVSEIVDLLSAEYDPRRLTQRQVIEQFNDPGDWDAAAPAEG